MNHSIWAILPAAGIGKRMLSSTPKQYLALNARPVIEYTINTLLANENVSGLVVALQADDVYWADIKVDSKKPLLRAVGGTERADSVLNAIKKLYEHKHFNAETDWLMVHDAVRPCLRDADINKLITEVAADENGGLLALQVRDTMKRQKPDDVQVSVEKTVERDNLWHALTPQYFPALALKSALESALQNDLSITDESSAMEMAGFSPRLVQGHEDNIKITRPNDLGLAGLYLQAQADSKISE